MPIPAMFTQDEHTEKLAAYFEDIYGYLIAQGVPEERLQSPWHVLSHVVDCIDGERMGEWIEAYLGIEGAAPSVAAEAVEAAPKEAPSPTKRPRPAYLRALSENSPREDPPTES
jgi:hypothetical protein